MVEMTEVERLTAERDGHMLQHLDALAEVKRVREEISRLRGALDDLAQRVEDDRREPDKLLCHVQSARHVLITGPRGTQADIAVLEEIVRVVSGDAISARIDVWDHLGPEAVARFDRALGAE